MDLGIAGKTAVVSASSKGLGRGCALALAAEGANVVISGRGEAELERTRRDIESLGVRVIAVQGDVTKPEAPAQLVQLAVDTFGSCDIVIANAGGPPAIKALDVTEADVQVAMNNNYLTSMRLANAAIPHMREKQWGRILLLTSSSIKEPIPVLSLSNSSRVALWAWAKTAATDLFEDGITINTICPGLHATDRMKELGKGDNPPPMGSPEDFGRTAAYLCSTSASFINGTAIGVDGGAMAGLY